MAKLLNESMMEQVNNSSLSTEATIIIFVTIDNLEPEHIVTVKNRNKGTMKYSLANTFLKDLSRTAMELQVFVEKASRRADSALHGRPKRHLTTYLAGNNKFTAA